LNLPALTSIGEYAFANCPLTTLNLPAAANIGDCAFAECPSLTTVNLPAATNIGFLAFAYCTALTAVNFPAAASLADCVFEGCTALTTVNLPALTSMGIFVFAATSPKVITVTLGRNAPALIGNPQGMGIFSRTIIIRRPANNTGYDAAWQDAFKRFHGKNSVITLVFQDF
jgi:hypothetical protein